MSSDKPLATVIGDVVESRAVDDRPMLHRALAEALTAVNDGGIVGCPVPVVPLRITIGDEYQGAFETVGDAIRAAFRLRLTLHSVADVRHGVGWGGVTVLSEQPRVEDGSGWWAAREAITAAHEDEQRVATRGVRTAYRRADGTDGADPAAVNAALLARDQLLADVGERSMSVLAGILAGMSQQQIAEQLQVSPSAVSQRVRRDGLPLVVQVDELLGEVR